jgi:hypothetical protein
MVIEMNKTRDGIGHENETNRIKGQGKANNSKEMARKGR